MPVSGAAHVRVRVARTDKVNCRGAQSGDNLRYLLVEILICSVKVAASLMNGG